jgi:PhnB protein
MLKDDLPFAVYLLFNGNCRQAFSYYQTCFGGELHVQTLGDTPDGIGMSKQMRKTVIWATLKNGYFKLVGTDLVGEGRIIAGNKASILIGCSSFTERTRLINKLIGRNFCSTENTNALINITDKYSINWVLSVS